MKCLLVDDEDGIRDGLAALLRLRGHEVRTAADRASALALLHGQPFDVLLTDWRLPDGDAADLITTATCPVVAASGHPEEVRGGERLFAVLQKPIAPTRLFTVLGEVAARTAAPQPAAQSLASLPVDVREVATQALALLDANAARLVDDGQFVTLTAPWPGDAATAHFEALGGDLRVLTPGGRPTLELRWCRDGRPELALPVVAATAAWPDNGAFAVDFDGCGLALAAVAQLAERAARLRAAGRRVCFLNVPRDCRAAIEVSGRGPSLPMRERIGPRLPAVLADLWS